jgi:hypothetical protein
MNERRSSTRNAAAAALLWCAAAVGEQSMPPYSAPRPGERVMSFYSNMPEHAISVTHGGAIGLGTFPPGIPTLSEPGIRNGLIADLKLADADGQVIGFATELELFPDGPPTQGGDIRWNTTWTLALAGRGMIFLEQIEHSGGTLGDIVKTVKESGADWTGDVLVTTTVGPLPSGRGRIVGGSGEFEGMRGSFVEIDHVTGFSTDGHLTAKLELRLFPQ